MLVLYRWIPEISGWREALFSGHFGTLVMRLGWCCVLRLLCRSDGRWSCFRFYACY